MIIALRNENGSYNDLPSREAVCLIIALRNENGSYNDLIYSHSVPIIIALRNENGSYNFLHGCLHLGFIIALRNEKDTPLIDNIILKIERILHAVRRVFQKKCLFSYRDLR